MTKVIIWDMDGVLADTGDAHYAAWRALYAERGERITYEQFAETFGMANGPILRQWLGDDTPEEEIISLGKHKEELFREQIAEHVHLLPGIRNWLGRAQAEGYRQVIASSGEMANIAAIAGTLEIANYFDALISGAFLPRSKPDPAIFFQAAAAAGASPETSIVIEDGLAGIEAARRANMACIAITTTQPRQRLNDADLVIDALDELEPNTFDRLLAH